MCGRSTVPASKSHAQGSSARGLMQLLRAPVRGDGQMKKTVGLFVMLVVPLAGLVLGNTALVHAAESGRLGPQASGIEKLQKNIY